MVMVLTNAPHLSVFCCLFNSMFDAIVLDIDFVEIYIKHLSSRRSVNLYVLRNAHNERKRTAGTLDKGAHVPDNDHAPGGTGKTFLINLLLANVRINECIALAVASSGIAATLLAGGRGSYCTCSF